jgi:hypothetical protein
MRWIGVVLAVLLAGCPSGGNQSNRVAGGGGKQTKSGPTGLQKVGKAEGGSGVGFAPCPTSPCMYHRGAGSYHSCLAADAGMCFHYGRACAPADRCMFEASSQSYRSCDELGSGQCIKFGAVCAPADACMLDPKDNVYRTCTSVSGGTCSKFGAACVPKA